MHVAAEKSFQNALILSPEGPEISSIFAAASGRFQTAKMLICVRMKAGSSGPKRVLADQ
jgi:hypothetical protein